MNLKMQNDRPFDSSQYSLKARKIKNKDQKNNGNSNEVMK